MNQEPVTMIVSYFAKEGKDDELLSLIEKHYPTLRSLDLVTDEPVKVWRAQDKRSGRSYFVEMFQWKDSGASDVAHQTPEVMAVWEPMGPLLEDMQLVRLEPLALGS